MSAASCFLPFDVITGVLLDLQEDTFPALFRGLRGQDRSGLAPRNTGEAVTTYGYVAAGTVTIEDSHGSFQLGPGHYFSLPGEGRIQGDDEAARCLFIEQFGDAGFFQIGGPVEDKGRLRYIDGCSDSLLLSPVMWGAPCLNLLHIPSGTRQSEHTHPSFRAGYIVSGHGRCVTPSGTFPLRPGVAFVIPTDSRHSFHTDEDSLRVIAYHPDSDFGPTHETHPMVNRTILSQPADS